MEYFGGIEAGGTKFNCIIASDPQHVVCEKTIQTKTPDVTIPEVVQFFKQAEKEHNLKLKALGLASFGPVNLDKSDPLFGSITSTPKPGWKNTPLLQEIKNHFNLPIGFDNDVNSAALGEGRWGAGQGLSDFLYITIGTGIGAGIVSNGLLLHGLIHPEMGHMLVKHDRIRDPFEGICPYHGDCLEGMASGPAVTKRWGISTHDMPDNHLAWDLEAEYLGQAVHNMSLFYSPKRIIMGGGVMKIPGLLAKVRTVARVSLNGYIDSDLIKQENESFIVAPQLGDRAGSMGAVVLASIALKS